MASLASTDARSSDSCRVSLLTAAMKEYNSFRLNCYRPRVYYGRLNRAMTSFVKVRLQTKLCGQGARSTKYGWLEEV